MGHDDFGHEQVTGDRNDRYRFRTPTLRNVAMTGPWGHDGAYDILRAMVRRHINPEQRLGHYDISQGRLPSKADLDVIDSLVHEGIMSRESLKTGAEIQPINLREAEINYLLAFQYVDGFGQFRHESDSA